MGGNKELRRCIECFQIPVFRPIEAEWCDPLGYLASISRQGELIGMAKIVPPSRWEAPHAPDQIGLKFKTKIQSFHELQWKVTVTEARQFWAMFNAFQESTRCCKSWKKPVFVGQEIDLYKLYRVVGKRGRCSEVCVFKNLMHSYMALYTLN
ncbi:Lysine-specific demethylase lid [Picochlorum sp. SENEW3]|nr:Lysine-specific demethylase lid [Picochlorum sp. SENEW3]